MMLGKDWAESIYPEVIEKNPSIPRNLKLISGLYETGIEVYPQRRADLFRAFRECPKDEVKVIILGQDPYSSNKATGLAFANPRNTPEKEYSPSLKVIQDALERSYPGKGDRLDPTLVHWANQGVLLLNCSLTTCPNGRYNFYSVWRPFISGVIKLITSDCEKVVVLMGNIAKGFREDVESFNCLIETTHPAHNARNNTALDLDFTLINSYLDLHYSTKIEWTKTQ